MAERSGPFTGHGVLRRFRRVRVRWWGVVLIVMATVLGAEVGVRMIEDDLAIRTGAEQRVLVKTRQIHDRGATDLVILGSSETGAGLRPRTIREHTSFFDSVYNAALVGTDPPVSEEWYRRVVGPELDPDVVVIGLQPVSLLVRDDQGLGAEPDEVARWSSAMDRSNAAYGSMFDEVAPGFFGRLGWSLHERSALIGLRSQLRSPTTALGAVLRRIGIDNDLAGSDGPDDRIRLETVDRDHVEAMIDSDGENLDYREPGDGEIDPAAASFYAFAGGWQLELGPLESLVDAVRASGAEPILALAPVDRIVLESSGVDLSRWDRLAADLVEWAEAHRVPVNDQFRAVYEADLFHDRHHLAGRGTDRWSTEVGTWLDELCRTRALSRC